MVSRRVFLSRPFEILLKLKPPLDDHLNGGHITILYYFNRTINITKKKKLEILYTDGDVRSRRVARLPGRDTAAFIASQDYLTIPIVLIISH